MLAIESGLSSLAEMDVVRINPYLPNTAERISLLEPHVVMIELNGKNNALALEILCQSIPLIVLDEARRSIIVLGTGHAPKVEINRLTNVIEEITQQQDVISGEHSTQPEEQ
jgi:hypothetical protein